MFDSYVEKFKKWRDRLTSRYKQVETSLQILEIMKGLCSLKILEIHSYSVTDCVKLVMEAARENNSTWEEMKLKYLLQLREAHMTVASFHMMRAEVFYIE